MTCASRRAVEGVQGFQGLNDGLRALLTELYVIEERKQN